MAAVTAPVSGLVIPQSAEPIRRTRTPWFVRCPPIYVVAIAVALGDGLGTLGFTFPLSVAIVLSATACVLFLIRAPESRGRHSCNRDCRRDGGAGSPHDSARVRCAEHSQSSRGLDAGGRGSSDPRGRAFPDKMRLYVEIDRASEEGAADASGAWRDSSDYASSGRVSTWRCGQVPGANPLSAQLRRSRRIRLRGLHATRRHRCDDAGGEGQSAHRGRGRSRIITMFPGQRNRADPPRHRRPSSIATSTIRQRRKCARSLSAIAAASTRRCTKPSGAPGCRICW